MYIYIYTYTYMYIYINTYIYTYIHTYAHEHTYASYAPTFNIRCKRIYFRTYERVMSHV